MPEYQAIGVRRLLGRIGYATDLLTEVQWKPGNHPPYRARTGDGNSPAGRTNRRGRVAMKERRDAPQNCN